MSGVDVLAQFAREHYLTKLVEAHGTPGVEIAKLIHPHLKAIYRAIDFDSIRTSLTVFSFIGVEDPSLVPEGGVDLHDLRHLPSYNKGTLSIQISQNGSRFTLWPAEIEPASLGSTALAYKYVRGVGEGFWIGGTKAQAPLPQGYPLFGLAIFRDLESALQRYAVQTARDSQCAIMQDTWREDARVMWKPAPEARLRKSLANFLRAALGDASPDVNEEAPADDRNPVDITVRWADSNRIGVIEVKWLGKSGTLDPPKITGEYSESRAKDGLKQLADYLDLTRGRANFFDSRGYLVVFDARRARVTASTSQCSREHGLAFLNADIAYDPDLLGRHDVAPPVRCFCEPNWVQNSPSKS